MTPALVESKVPVEGCHVIRAVRRTKLLPAEGVTESLMKKQAWRSPNFGRHVLMMICILACGKWPGYEGRRGWSAQCTLVLLYAVSHRDRWMLSVSITCSDFTKKMITTALHFSTLQKPRTFIVIEELEMSFEPQRVSKVNS